jgi:hypothetical protein
MALPLFIRKLIAPVEVRLVLSAFSKEVRKLEDAPSRGLAGGIATGIVTPKVVDDILGYAKQISRDIHNGRPPRVLASFFMMNVARNYLASGGFAILGRYLSRHEFAVDAGTCPLWAECLLS